MSSKLTIKQEKFSQEYVINGGNASEAYRKAYDAKGSKEHTINCRAYDMMQRGEIADRIKQIQIEANKRYQISMDKLTKRLVHYIEDGELPLTKKSKRMRDPDLARRSVMDLAKLHGFLRNTDEPISATYVRMDNVIVNGKPVDWGVGKKPEPKK